MSEQEKKPLSDKCAVVRDLMPLVIDGTASDASRRKVDKHVSDCKPCAKVYEEMKASITLDAPVEVDNKEFDQVIKKVKTKRRRRSWKNVLIGALATLLVICLGTAGYLWYDWNYIQQVPLSSRDWWCDMSLVKLENGTAVVHVSGVPEDAQFHARVVQEGFPISYDGASIDITPSYRLYTWVTINRAADMEHLRIVDRDFALFNFVDESSGVISLNNGSIGLQCPIKAIIVGAPDSVDSAMVAYWWAGEEVPVVSEDQCNLSSVSSVTMPFTGQYQPE